MKIVIPAYEPDCKLISLIKSIQSNCDYDIVLVNDGSSPSCNVIFQEAEALGCTVLSHEANMGKGAALKTAFTYLLTLQEKEGLVCADCDGQHTWQDILRIAEAVLTHPNSIILGCRDFVGKVPARSMLGNKITGFFYSLIAKKKVTDTQTGLRGFSTSMLPWLVSIKGDRYEYEMKQLLEAKESGYDILSVPIETIYEDQNKSSHFHPVRDSIRIYLPILKFTISSAGCGILDFIIVALLYSLTRNLLLSVITARVISSICNFYINKTVVFQHTKSYLSSTVKYYILVLIILGCNYALMKLFIVTLGMPLILAKLLTESILYAFSYIMQHKIVFK